MSGTLSNPNTVELETTELPKEVENVSQEIGLEPVPPEFVQHYMKRVLGQKSQEELRRSFMLQNVLFKKAKPAKVIKGKEHLKHSARRQLYHLPKKNALTFNQFYPVHVLWKEYMSELVSDSLNSPSQLYIKLMKADYHGCYVVVSSCVCKNRIGLRGLVVQETRNTFRVLTHRDTILVIPKAGTTFAFHLSGKLIKIYGDNFCYQAAERTKVKFKTKLLKSL